MIKTYKIKIDILTFQTETTELKIGRLPPT